VRRAFITGGSKGIGAAIVRRLAAEGVKVVLSAQDMPLAEALAKQTGATAIRLNVTDLRAAHAAVTEHGPFDILVNNAGVDQHAFFTQTTMEEWRALLAVNPRGSVVMPGSGCFWAWPFEQGGEFGGHAPPMRGIPLDDDIDAVSSVASPGGNTTIGVVATNAVLSKVEAQRLAMMAQDGLARAIRPSHTPFDGDTLFVLATGRHALAGPRAQALAALGAIAADCVARAVARGVHAAASLGAWRCWRDAYGGPR